MKVWSELNLVVDTIFKWCHKAEERVLLSLVGLLMQPGRFWGHNLWSGRGSRRPWRRTIGQPQRSSGKPFSTLEGGSSAQPVLFTVEVGSCWLTRATFSDVFSNYRGITLLSSHTFYARVLKGEFGRWLNLGFRRNNAVSVFPGCQLTVTPGTNWNISISTKWC